MICFNFDLNKHRYVNLPGVLDDTLEDLTDLEGIVEDLLELDEVWLPDLKKRKIMQIISRIFLKIVLFFRILLTVVRMA